MFDALMDINLVGARKIFPETKKVGEAINLN